MTNDTAGARMSGNQGLTSLVDLDRKTLRTDFWTFVVMLVLGIGGVAMSQSEDRGHWLWLYWYALVLVYAAISLIRGWLKARTSNA